MNALKTFVHQIEAFGILQSERRTKNTNHIIKIYRIDTVTSAIIIYSPNGKPKEARFAYTSDVL